MERAVEQLKADLRLLQQKRADQRRGRVRQRVGRIECQRPMCRNLSGLRIFRVILRASFAQRKPVPERLVRVGLGVAGIELDSAIEIVAGFAELGFLERVEQR